MIWMSLSLYSAMIAPVFFSALSEISFTHVSRSTFKGSAPFGSDMFLSPYLMYGPKRPLVQMISIPSCCPTVRGSSNSFSASSRVMLSISWPGARLAYYLLSPSPFWTYGPYCPNLATSIYPSLGSMPSSRLTWLYSLLLSVSCTFEWKGP